MYRFRVSLKILEHNQDRTFTSTTAADVVWDRHAVHMAVFAMSALKIGPAHTYSCDASARELWDIMNHDARRPKR